MFFYEKDLNIHIMKTKDIYLAFRLKWHVYCEGGYSFNLNCKKKLK